MRRIFQPSPVPFGNFAGKLFLVSLCTYFVAAAVGFVWLVPPHTLGDVAGVAVVAIVVLPFLYPLVLIGAAYITIFTEKFVSHDLLIYDVVGKKVLVAIFVILILSLGARKYPLGRLIAFTCVAAITLACVINFFGWVQQGA